MIVFGFIFFHLLRSSSISLCKLGKKKVHKVKFYFIFLPISHSFNSFDLYYLNVYTKDNLYKKLGIPLSCSLLKYFFCDSENLKCWTCVLLELQLYFVNGKCTWTSIKYFVTLAEKIIQRFIVTICTMFEDL